MHCINLRFSSVTLSSSVATRDNRSKLHSPLAAPSVRDSAKIESKLYLWFSSVAPQPSESELSWHSAWHRFISALAAPSVGVRRGFTARCGPRGCWRGTSSRATMCSTPSVRNIWWNIPTCSTHGPTWTLEGQACRGERTDAKPSAMMLASIAEVRRRKTKLNQDCVLPAGASLPW